MKVYLLHVLAFNIAFAITVSADNDSSSNDSGSSNIFKSSFNLTVTLDAIENAREAIISVTKEFTKANGTNLSAKFLRLAFHDAIGGMDGCVDLSHSDNFGLEIPIDALKPIVKEYSTPETGLSRADIWALSSVTGVEISQVSSVPLKFPLQYIGRVDCDAPTRTEPCLDSNQNEVSCTYDRGPSRPAPSPHLDTTALLHFFRTVFDFSPRQTVVIMGAHTLGFAKRENSGFNGPVGWVRDPNKFNNEYYRMLVGQGNCVEEYVELAPNWSTGKQKNDDIVDHYGNAIPDRFLWTRRSSDSSNVDGDSVTLDLIMTTSDIALVRDFTGYRDKRSNDIKCEFIFGTDKCPFSRLTGDLMAEYRRDNKKWLNDFRDTFNLMITHKYDTSFEGDVPDECTNCLIQVDFSITKHPTSSPSGQPSIIPVIETNPPSVETVNPPESTSNALPLRAYSTGITLLTIYGGISNLFFSLF